MVTILILAVLAGIVYLVYRAIPTKQEVYDAEQKEKNLISEVETKLKDDVSTYVVEIKKDI
jgi:Tfp pilus assembly protein PilE